MNPKTCLLFMLVFVVLMHESVAQPSYCLLPAEGGPCRARMIRYAYNSASGQCEQFIYGGCNGNANNFKSKEMCEQICKKK